MLLSGILSLEYTNEMSYNRLVVKNLSAEDTMKKRYKSFMAVAFAVVTLCGCTPSNKSIIRMQKLEEGVYHVQENH